MNALRSCSCQTFENDGNRRKFHSLRVLSEPVRHLLSEAESHAADLSSMSLVILSFLPLSTLGARVWEWRTVSRCVCARPIPTARVR